MRALKRKLAEHELEVEAYNKRLHESSDDEVVLISDKGDGRNSIMRNAQMGSSTTRAYSLSPSKRLKREISHADKENGRDYAINKLSSPIKSLHQAQTNRGQLEPLDHSSSLNFVFKESPGKIRSPLKSPTKGLLSPYDRSPLVRSSSAVAFSPTPSPSPSISRTLDLKHVSSIYARAKAHIRLAVSQQKVQGREQERARVMHFLDSLDAQETSSPNSKKASSPNSAQANNRVLYVSGSPGIGKTLCVKGCIQAWVQKKIGKAVELNCMSLSTPNAIWQGIYIACTGETYKGADVKDALERRLQCQRFVIMLDEVDHLSLTLLQLVLSLPTRVAVQIIGIANTTSLTSSLPPNISRDVQILHFAPYTHEQLGVISRAYLDSYLPLFQPQAIDLGARKVAAATGDVRRMVDLLCSALDLVDREKKKGSLNLLTPQAQSAKKDDSIAHADDPNLAQKVTPTQILKAYNSISMVSKAQTVISGTAGIIKNLPLHSKIALLAFILYQKQNANKSAQPSPIGTSTLHDHYSKILSGADAESHIPPLSRSDFGGTITMLIDSGLVTAQPVSPSKRGPGGRTKELPLLLSASETFCMQYLTEGTGVAEDIARLIVDNEAIQVRKAKEAAERAELERKKFEMEHKD